MRLQSSRILASAALALSLTILITVSAGRAGADTEVRIDPYRHTHASGTSGENRRSENRPCPKPAAKMELMEAQGPLTDVIEPNILEVFKTRVRRMQADGTYDKKLSENKAKIRDALQNPPPIARLSKAADLRVWDIVPSIPEKLPESLMLASRSVELPKLPRALLFIDARDETNLEAAQKLLKKLPQTRIVLTAGSLAETSERLGVRIFFDQGGALTRGFGIHAVPALLFNGESGPQAAEFPVERPEIIFPYLRS